MNRDWKLCLGAVLILSILYSPLYSAHFSPGSGDDAFYLSVARNLATGQGYRWNGSPVMIAPPGWPLVLAAAMRFFPQFAVLNLIPLALCLIAAGLWYWVLRRFTSAGHAFVITVLGGLLFYWHRNVFHHYSESLFFVLLAGSLLLAQQISEGKTTVWRIVLLQTLCVLIVFVRWPGVLTWPLIASALVSGQNRPKPKQGWLVVLLSGAVMVGALVGTRAGLRAYASLQLREGQGVEQPELASMSLAADSRRIRYALGGSKMLYLQRLGACGTAMSRLLWPPAQIGRCSPIIEYTTAGMGWLLILGFLVLLWHQAKQREWIWLGVLLYCGTLALLRAPTGRYWAPVAHLLLLGVLQGLGLFRRPASGDASSRLATAAAIALLVTVGVCNAATLGVNAWVSRSKNFTSICLAGEYEALIEVADYINQRSDEGARVGIEEYYYYGDKIRKSTFTQRMIQLLTNRKINPVPLPICSQQDDELLTNWIIENDIRFYLRRMPGFRPRLWHFRLPGPRTQMDNSAGGEADGYYELYELQDGRLVKIELSAIRPLLRKVPGL